MNVGRMSKAAVADEKYKKEAYSVLGRIREKNETTNNDSDEQRTKKRGWP